MINRCRLGPRQKTEECNTSRVGINLAKTEKGHPFIELVRYCVRAYQCGKYCPAVI